MECKMERESSNNQLFSKQKKKQNIEYVMTPTSLHDSNQSTQKGINLSIHIY